MSKPSPGLKPWRTIQTGPTSDAFRSGWDRTFGAFKRKVKRSRKAATESPRSRVEELRAAADRAHSGDNAAELEREADALEAAARAEGVWDG